MSEKLSTLPPIYYLTLEDQIKRINSIESDLVKHNLTATRVIGIDGRATDIRKKEYNHVVTGDYFSDMSSGDVCCALGHIKMLQAWLKTAESDVAIFFEDDVNLDCSNNWSFDWKEFMAEVNAQKKDWKVIQLALIRSDPIKEVRFRVRVTADWCVTAYIMKRDYAEFLVSRYVRPDGGYHLSVPGDPRAIPIVENLIYFPAEPHVYCVPLFTEKGSFGSTFFPNGIASTKDHNTRSLMDVSNWWMKHGKSTPLKNIMSEPNLPPSIPMIGTAVVANPKWVKRLIDSVDYPVDEFMIINNNGRGEIDADLDRLSIEHNNRFIKKVRVLHMPENLGVPASWNLMIKSYLRCPFWIIVNDDVAFCPGFLAEMHTETQRDPGAGLIHGHAGDHGIGSWDLFLIRDHVIREYGLFDENLYPAYGEDADYFLRFRHKPLRRIMSLKSNYLHGDGTKNDYHTHGRQTAKSDPTLEEKLNKVNLTNFEYMRLKWGPGWRSCDVTEFPFEESRGRTLPISYTTFDIDFMRSKHLGF